MPGASVRGPYKEILSGGGRKVAYLLRYSWMERTRLQPSFTGTGAQSFDFPSRSLTLNVVNKSDDCCAVFCLAPPICSLDICAFARLKHLPKLKHIFLKLGYLSWIQYWLIMKQSWMLGKWNLKYENKSSIWNITTILFVILQRKKKRQDGVRKTFTYQNIHVVIWGK